MELSAFHPSVRAWFDFSFKSETPVQAEAWSAIGSGQNVLIAAPTGSGKTFAAFLCAINDLVEQGRRKPWPRRYPALLAFLEFGWPAALVVVIAYVLINSAMDDVIKPRIMGEGLDLAPVVVFISVIFWGLILGPLGGILAVPATLAIKQLLLEPDPQSHWIADMMSAKEVAAADNGDDRPAVP